MRIFKQLAQAVCFTALLPLFAAPVLAATIENDFDVGLVTPSTPRLIGSDYTTTVENSMLGDTFEDTWNFQTTGDTTILIHLQSYEFGGYWQIGDLNGDLGGAGGTEFTVDVTGTEHVLVVTGTLDGTHGGSYQGTIAAVPLPAAVWLFGSAIMGLTVSARRRKNSGVTTA